MDSYSQVPPGFRFHPTDEELVDYYLRKKVASKRIDLDVIKEVDLYKIEPWDLQELCRIGSEDQDEWYFFSHKDKKYPTGSRTNRATKAGFWKATGRDKAIYSKHALVGMRKTLVFYIGRAPNGQKSDWIMHEYRLETNELGTPQEEGWAVCRVFKKKMTAIPKMGRYETSPCNRYEDQMFFNASEIQANTPRRYSSSFASYPPQNPNFPCKQELELKMTYQLQYHHHPSPFHLPQLESPQKVQQSYSYCNNMSPLNVPCGASKNNNGSSTISEYLQQEEVIQQGEEDFNLIYGNTIKEQQDHKATDWRVLDKFVASQLSNEETAAGVDILREDQIELKDSENFERLPKIGDQEYGKLTSASASDHTNLWK